MARRSASGLDQLSLEEIQALWRLQRKHSIEREHEYDADCSLCGDFDIALEVFVDYIASTG